MIRITGDPHGDISRFYELYYNHGEGHWTKDDILIFCGDWGFLFLNNKSENSFLDDLSSRPYTICFVDGNHENFDAINAYPTIEWNGGKAHQIRKNIFHLMRGQVFTIEGKTFFTMGGAECHDIYTPVQDPADPHFRENCRELYERGAFFRIKGKSWWPEELPDDGEYAEGWKNLRAHGMQVDYILTHCAPREVQRLLIPRLCHGLYPENALTEILQQISEQVTFREWFFGHYHGELTTGKYRLLYEELYPLD